MSVFSVRYGAYSLGPVIIYVRGGGGGKKKGGVKAISDWQEEELNSFIKKLRGVSSLIASYISQISKYSFCSLFQSYI